jgi:hypothetical protein
MILDGDDIRRQVHQAEDWYGKVRTFESHATVALWVIAEQLYELRQLISISLEKEK